jgi:uncharacterized protein YaiL (DUF2058 family)
VSLKDQLLKAGLVSKKDARRAGQEKRKERKKKQGQRRKKSALRAEEEARQRAAAAKASEERIRARKEQTAVREERELTQRIRQIVLGNRMGGRGPVPFHHKGLDGRTLHRLELTEKMGWNLRCGKLAIAALPEPGGAMSYHVVTVRAADKLAELDPTLVVFRVSDTTGISAPEEGFLSREWEPSLTPHRVAQPGRVSRG